MKRKEGREEEKKGEWSCGARRGAAGLFPSSTELNREPISQSFGFGVGPHTNEMFHLSPLNVCSCLAIAATPFHSYRIQRGPQLALASCQWWTHSLDAPFLILQSPLTTKLDKFCRRYESKKYLQTRRTRANS
jgi:hypothetical protein